MRVPRKTWLLGYSWSWVHIIASSLKAPFDGRFIGRDSMSRKSRNENGSSPTVNTFRTVAFDDWLRLFMQVHQSSS